MIVCASFKRFEKFLVFDSLCWMKLLQETFFEVHVHQRLQVQRRALQRQRLQWTKADFQTLKKWLVELNLNDRNIILFGERVNGMNKSSNEYCLLKYYIDLLIFIFLGIHFPSYSETIEHNESVGSRYSLVILCTSHPQGCRSRWRFG